MRWERVTPFPHVDIRPDQVLLANRHAAHDADGNGLALSPTLCANITLHSSSSLVGVSAATRHFPCSNRNRIRSGAGGCLTRLDRIINEINGLKTCLPLHPILPFETGISTARRSVAASIGYCDEAAWARASPTRSGTSIGSAGAMKSYTTTAMTAPTIGATQYTRRN